jgi:hypothetical protein
MGFISLKRVKLKDIVHPGKLFWSNSQKNLKSKIEDGYNPRKGMISISVSNKIFDGKHRFTILLDKYGPEHTIIVRKIFFSRSLYYLFLYSITPILFVVALFLIIFKKTPKNEYY